MANQQYDEHPLGIFSDQFLDSGTPGQYSRFFAGNYATNFRFDTLQLFNTDTIDHTVILDLSSTGVTPIAFATVPAGAGLGIVPPFDVLGWNYPAANHYLIMPDVNLYWTVGEAVNTGKMVDLVGFGGWV